MKYTAEQFILLNYVKTLVGATPTYVNLFYQGVIAASEFTVYNAKKLYIAFETKFGHLPIVNNGTLDYVTFYDAANAVNLYAAQNGVYWSTVVPGPCSIEQSLFVNNIYFSRIVVSRYTYMVFNGIKVTWP